MHLLISPSRPSDSIMHKHGTGYQQRAQRRTDIQAVKTAAQARIHLACPHMTNLASKALNPALVDGLEILGRGDVRDKRLHQPPNCDAQVVEGTLGITSVLAAQMKRSIEYAKRANRPQIICDAVDQFSLAAR